jgi:hypothetical protein
MADVPLPEPKPLHFKLRGYTAAQLHAHAAAVSAAENARLREALQAVQTAMHGAWAEGRLTSPPWTDALAAQVADALKGARHE